MLEPPAAAAGVSGALSVTPRKEHMSDMKMSVPTSVQVVAVAGTGDTALMENPLIFGSKAKAILISSDKDGKSSSAAAVKGKRGQGKGPRRPISRGDDVSLSGTLSKSSSTESLPSRAPPARHASASVITTSASHPSLLFGVHTTADQPRDGPSKASMAPRNSERIASKSPAQCVRCDVLASQSAAEWWDDDGMVPGLGSADNMRSLRCETCAVAAVLFERCEFFIVHFYQCIAELLGP